MTILEFRKPEPRPEQERVADQPVNPALVAVLEDALADAKLGSLVNACIVFEVAAPGGSEFVIPQDHKYALIMSVALQNKILALMFEEEG